MNCVILGGEGFIGSHVAELLHEKGMKVFIFDQRNMEAGNAHRSEHLEHVRLVPAGVTSV